MRSSSADAYRITLAFLEAILTPNDVQIEESMSLSLAEISSSNPNCLPDMMRREDLPVEERYLSSRRFRRVGACASIFREFSNSSELSGLYLIKRFNIRRYSIIMEWIDDLTNL